MKTLPPNEPLDEEERELARVLRALPGGEPPAALDVAILRAATNAAASSKRPVRRVLASAGALWGIGSAAAAVLALGVAWQLRFGVHDQAGEAARAPGAHMVSDAAEDESVQVEIGEQAANAPTSPPPPMAASKPAAPADAQLRRQAPAQPARVAAASAPAAAPAAEPEPFAADREDDSKTSSGLVSPVGAQLASAMRDKEKADAIAAEGARAEESVELKERSEQTAKSAAYANAAQAAPPPPPPPAYRPAAVGGGFVAAQSPAKAAAAGAVPAPAASRADSSVLDQVGAVASVAPQSEVPPRKPATWLADIRKLRDQGRIAEAHAALVEFHKKYPKWVIPTDLAPLLSE